MSCNIIQHGIDGFGHQLHGLFSTIILHNIKNYNFRGDLFINKNFHFAYVSKKEGLELQNYMIESINYFIKSNIINYEIINSHIHSHEIYKIPTNYDKNTIYSIDNAYYFEKIGLSEEEKILHNNNINNFKKFFIENKYLPSNRLEKNNIVIHIRLGDALHDDRRNELLDFNKKVIKLLDKLIIDYPNYKIYIHSNGNPNFIDKNKYNFIFYPESTPLMQVLSDLIHSKIFVCGSSALSKISAFLGNHEKIIIPDDTKNSMPKNCIKMSDYINLI